MRADAEDVGALRDRHVEIVLDRRESWDAEHAEPDIGELLARDPKHVAVAQPRFADLQRGCAQPVAVTDLDDRYASGVRRRRVPADLLSSQLMPHGVVAVTQRGVADEDAGGRRH